MPTTVDVLRVVFARSSLPRIAMESVVRTVPSSLSLEVGTLNAVQLKDLLAHVETGLKTFAGRVEPLVMSEVRAAVTGGRPVPALRETLNVSSDVDVMAVQRRCQQLTRGFFGATDCVRIATAVSELARNIYMYARTGSITLSLKEEQGEATLEVLAIDDGPGIADLDRILAGGYVSRTGLGRGLAGTRALLNEFEVITAPGRGTRVRGVKRVRRI